MHELTRSQVVLLYARMAALNERLNDKDEDLQKKLDDEFDKKIKEAQERGIRKQGKVDKKELEDAQNEWINKIKEN